ncbi:hypothetical protein CPB86DRAFT_765957 [Serendipita vermifera]|nr:hypothetical protein CPB86DRAFT_765957 [Serendipita vermifera]
MATFASSSNSQAQVKEPDLLLLVQNYKLPPVVSVYVEELKNDANAVAVTSALFAAVLITLAQLIPTDDGGAPREALRLFVFCSVVVNLTASGLSSCNSWMVSEIPRQAVMLILKDRDSLPYKVAVVNQPLTSQIISDRMRLMTKFGMDNLVRWTYYWGAWMYLFGNALTFTAFVIWVWTEQSRVVASISMIFVVPCVIFLFYPLSKLLLIGKSR